MVVLLQKSGYYIRGQTDVRQIKFLYGQITEEVLVSVEGATWKGVEPAEFSFYEKSYNDIEKNIRYL